MYCAPEYAQNLVKRGCTVKAHYILYRSVFSIPTFCKQEALLKDDCYLIYCVERYLNCLYERCINCILYIKKQTSNR